MVRAFISYSHDSKAHSDRVLALAMALGKDGIHVELDQFHNDEIVDWPRWCGRQIGREHSDFVLCVCTAEYSARIEGKVPPERGKGVYWEGALLDDELYDEKGNSRFIPILFDDEPETSVIRILHGWTQCRLRKPQLSDDGYEHLLRILTGQPRVVKGPVGTIPDLPPGPLPLPGPGGASVAPPQARKAGAPRQLPAPVGDFMGRDGELAELLEGVDGGGATISGVAGMAGVGKTQLALELAKRVAADYPDGQIYLDLRGADPNQQTPLTPAEAMRHVLVSFDPARTLPDEAAALEIVYRNELSGRRALLLMDNAADKDQVEPLIPPDACLLLVTSRQFFVLPDHTPLSLDTLDGDGARDLLLRICERIGDCAARIAELCGRLPLALRVVASTLAERPAMTPKSLIERLQAKPLEQLNEVERAIAVSEALLDEYLRGHFHALSIFPGSFEHKAAARVLELYQNAADDALDELVRRSLLQWDDEAKRYCMHDLVRLFADARLSGERRVALKMRHARVYCDVLNAADDLYLKHGEKTFEGLALFDREWGNIQAGFAAVSARVDSDEHAAHLCSGYLAVGLNCPRLRQAPSERIAWFKAAVAAAQRLDDAPMEANHLGNLGLIYQTRGDLGLAEEMYRKVLKMEETLGRRESTAKAYCNLGLIFRARGELDEAERMVRKSLAIEEKLGRRQELSALYCALGTVCQARGNLGEAERMHRKALEIDEKLGRLEGMASEYGNLGIIFKQHGDLDEAERMYRKCLEILEKLGLREGMATAYGNLAYVFLARGDPDEAEKMLRKSLEIDEKLGLSEGMANQYVRLGIIFEQRGDADEARRLWTQARGLYARIGIPHMVEKVQGGLDALPDAKE